MAPLSSLPSLAPVASPVASPDTAALRTVYLGNVPPSVAANPSLLLDRIHAGGGIEKIRIFPEKHCVFVSFLSPLSAQLFYKDACLNKLSVDGSDIRIGWAKEDANNSALPPSVSMAIHRDKASRNVYLGNLPSSTTKDQLYQDFKSFGEIDTVRYIPSKSIAFVHFLSILSAIRAVQQVPLDPKYSNTIKIYYGKDRCESLTPLQIHNATQYLGLSTTIEESKYDHDYILSALIQQTNAAITITTSNSAGANNLGNRTIYLGSLHESIKIDEICNVVRAGLIENIKLLSSKNICFITFIDSIASSQFFAMCNIHQLFIHNKRVKVKWGKHSGPLSLKIENEVLKNGATRNIYIGNLKVNENTYNLLEFDFLKFGDIEQINFLPEKKCAFVNFTNIENSIKALNEINKIDSYKDLQISYGKDRCSNMPRQFQSQSFQPAQKDIPNQQQQQQQQQQ